MVRKLFAALAGIALATGFVGVALAAPKEGKNHQLETVDCGDLGEFEVLTGENAVTGFAEDEVFVAKKFAFDMLITVTTFDGQEWGPTEDSFTEGGKGQGYQDRLIECALPGSFTDIFILDEGAAEFFGIPDEYVGTEVTAEGSGTGTVWIIDPGR